MKSRGILFVLLSCIMFAMEGCSTSRLAQSPSQATAPTIAPTLSQDTVPTTVPASAPTLTPVPTPTMSPAPSLTVTPTPSQATDSTITLTLSPDPVPTMASTSTPIVVVTLIPTVAPTAIATPSQAAVPMIAPTQTPTPVPTSVPEEDVDSLYPDVPKTGTWQLKETTGKKYIILGTDDDNEGNAKFFRLLRTYGFPYTMNTEAENVIRPKALGADTDDSIFTPEDAPALFPDGVDVVTLGKYLHDNKLGEVAQHGISSSTLWDSEKLTGDFLTSLHASYMAQGGTKSKEDFRAAIPL